MDELEETMEIMSDKKLLKSIQRGINDLKEGRYVTYTDVDSMFRELRDGKRKSR